MKKLLRIVLVLSLLISLAGCGSKEKTVSERDLLLGINAATYLSNHDFESLYVMFDIDTKEKITVEQLKEQLEEIHGTYGEIIEIDSEDVTGQYISGKSIVYVPIRFASGWMNLQCAIQSSSLYELSITVSDKLDEDGYNETQFSVNVDDYVIKAVCTRPNVMTSNAPIVILMNGKDAFDVNSTIGVNKVFKNLAYELADEGVIVVRYERVVNDFNVEDSVELIEKELNEVIDVVHNTSDLTDKPIYVFGYDVSGYLLPQISLSLSIPVHGFIIASAMSGEFADHMYQEYLYNLKANNVKDSIEYERLDAMIAMIHSLETPEDYIYNIFGYSSSFWLSIKDYDPLETLNLMPAKVLVTGGSNDFQIASSEFNAWKNAKHPDVDVTYKYFKNMTHLFSIKDTESTPTSYYQEAPIAEAFVKEIVKFVNE